MGEKVIFVKVLNAYLPYDRMGEKFVPFSKQSDQNQRHDVHFEYFQLHAIDVQCLSQGERTADSSNIQELVPLSICLTGISLLKNTF